MRKLILYCFLLNSITTSAQSIAKTTTNKADGSTTIATTREGLYLQLGDSWLAMTGDIVTTPADSLPSFHFKLDLRGQRKASISPDKSNVMLLTDKGERVKLTYTGKHKSFTPDDLSIDMNLNVTREQLEALSASRVTDIKVMTDQLTDYPIKGEKQKTVANIAKLLIKASKKT